MAGKPLVESMNVTSSHPKLRTTLRFAEPLYVAGDAVSGKMEVECKAEKGLAMGVIKVELFGVEGRFARFISLHDFFNDSQSLLLAIIRQDSPS